MPRTRKNTSTFVAIAAVVVIIGVFVMTMVWKKRETYKDLTSMSDLPKKKKADNTGPRIIGGYAVGQYPSWMVRLPGCGGSLIRPKFVLTANHCKIGVGAVAHIGNVETRTVVRVVPAPNGVDMAILELDSPSTQTPIAVSALGMWPPGSQLSTLGHGLPASFNWFLTEIGVQPRPEMTAELRRVELNVISQPECRRNLRTYRPDFQSPEIKALRKWCMDNVSQLQTDVQKVYCSRTTPQGWKYLNRESLKYMDVRKNSKICTIGHGKSACHGDSGGPLVFHVLGYDFLTGIVKGGPLGCNFFTKDGMHTSVFTAIRPNYDWIVSIAGPY